MFSTRGLELGAGAEDNGLYQYEMASWLAGLQSREGSGLYYLHVLITRSNLQQPGHNGRSFCRDEIPMSLPKPIIERLGSS